MPKRVDENQAEIHARLRELGCSVQSLATIGGGCPDSLVGYKGENFIFEIKNPKRKPSERMLNDKQQHWHGNWNGHVHTIETLSEVIDIIKKWKFHMP